MSAFRGIKELRRPESLKPAVTALSDTDPSVREQAVAVIGWLKFEESLPALISACRDQEAVVRRSAVAALGFSVSPHAASAVIAALDDKDWMVREIAAETAARTGGVDAGKRLIAALADAYWQVTLKAVRSLGKLRVTESVAPIGPLLDHDMSNLRKEVAGALGEIGHPSALAFLQRHVDDPDPDVRKNVRWAMTRLRKE
jgi:HEAT repeat protein